MVSIPAVQISKEMLTNITFKSIEVSACNGNNQFCSSKLSVIEMLCLEYLLRSYMLRSCPWGPGYMLTTSIYIHPSAAGPGRDTAAGVVTSDRQAFVITALRICNYADI